jgi:DNA (cytosine-5)-methyltransferase 1
MKHIGLFEGIGGFSLAARWAGWETIAWCEWNEFGQKVLRHHFPEATGHGDITKTDFTIYANKIDILTGGFPCQPYSTAGKRLGKDDERHLWPEMLRAIREIQPRWVVGENVRGLVNWNGGMVFDEVQANLEACGYEVLPFILPACAKNAPHRRDRVWFVGYSKHNGLHATEIGRNEQKPSIKTGANKVGEFERASGMESIGAFANADSIRLQCEGKSTELGRERLSKHHTQSNQPNWDNFPTQPPICGGDDGIPIELDGITFSKWRNESIKAYGNAIVPQIAYEIFKAINDYENL